MSALTPEQQDDVLGEAQSVTRLEQQHVGIQCHNYLHCGLLRWAAATLQGLQHKARTFAPEIDVIGGNAQPLSRSGQRPKQDQAGA